MTVAAAPKAAKRVLVIEDEPTMAKVIARTLAAAGFETTVELSGIGGLERLRSETYDLVVLDLMLPDFDGFALLSSTTDLAAGLPVLVLSALDDVRSKVVSLELGASDYITKPFDLAELVARARLQTRDRHAGRRRRLRGNGLELDPNRHLVRTSENEEIQLTTRESALLAYLMEQGGEVCTRQAILEHVWGSAFYPGTNVVDVCVGRLRHKLGHDCVATIRNVGYAFVAG